MQIQIFGKMIQVSGHHVDRGDGVRTRIVVAARMSLRLQLVNRIGKTVVPPKLRQLTKNDQTVRKNLKAMIIVMLKVLSVGSLLLLSVMMSQSQNPSVAM